MVVVACGGILCLVNDAMPIICQHVSTGYGLAYLLSYASSVTSTLVTLTAFSDLQTIYLEWVKVAQSSVLTEKIVFRPAFHKHELTITITPVL